MGPPKHGAQGPREMRIFVENTKTLKKDTTGVPKMPIEKSYQEGAQGGDMSF